jgi:ubiquitin C-terminal hydrolase
MSPGTTIHKGLKNRGENLCFLNVVIQALWHLEPFREQFMHRNAHVHKQSSTSGLQDCLSCELTTIFNNYEFGEDQCLPANRMQQALHVLTNQFAAGAMADAKEALEAVLLCIHREQSASNADSDCTPLCISHSIFGCDMCNILVCEKCGLQQPMPSRDICIRVYVSDLLAANCKTIGKALQTTKDTAIKCPVCQKAQRSEKLELPDSRFYGLERDEKHSEYRRWTVSQRWCFRLAPVLSVSLEWPQESPDKYVIEELLEMIESELALDELFYLTDSSVQYILRGMLCYYGRHYIAVFRGVESWYFLDDQCVRDVGSWSDVKTKLIKGHNYPVMLFYEEVPTPKDSS